MSRKMFIHIFININEIGVQNTEDIFKIQIRGQSISLFNVDVLVMATHQRDLMNSYGIC